MSNLVKKYLISELSKEEYLEVRDNLAGYLKEIGDVYSWETKLTLTNHSKYIRFYKYDWLFNVHQSIDINLRERELIIESSCSDTTSFGYNETKRNIKNVDKVLTILPQIISKYLLSETEIKRKISYEQKLKKINDEKEKLVKDKVALLQEFDKNSDGQVDLIDCDAFNKMLDLNQITVSEFDKNVVHKFVKISIYLNTKKSNIQKVYKSIKKINNESELIEYKKILQNQINSYNLLVFHSINMLTSLVEKNLITFYEIYESFDQLGVFNSNWENEVSNKLSDIGAGLHDLMYSIYQMENRVVNSIKSLNYLTQGSFKILKTSVENQLTSINSSMNFNNLLSIIQTYQMYKVNKNTKNINSK